MFCATGAGVLLCLPALIVKDGDGDDDDGGGGRRKGTRYSLKMRSSLSNAPVTLVQCISSCGNRSSTYLILEEEGDGREHRREMEERAEYCQGRS